MFTNREQLILMNKIKNMEKTIIHKALENLKKNTGITGVFTPLGKNGLDGVMSLLLENGNERFVVEIRREIRYHQLDKIKQIAKINESFMLVAENIFPKIKEELKDNGIYYLDGAGNIFLKTINNFIWIEGHKPEKTVEEIINRAFTSTGLKVVYSFLVDENMLNQPQRIISENSGVALGNVNYVLNGLKEQEFLIKKGRKQFELINKKNLLEKWIYAYQERLKPKIHIGNFSFANEKEERQWKQLKLNKNQTFWGGEPAGDIITGYLNPELFTLYTDETGIELIKNYRLIPDKIGNISVYTKFWVGQAAFRDIAVHPLLAYTDLMNTNNGRCIETAKIIYEQYLKKDL